MSQVCCKGVTSSWALEKGSRKKRERRKILINKVRRRLQAAGTASQSREAHFQWSLQLG